jgi:hypothetical protein
VAVVRVRRWAALTLVALLGAMPLFGVLAALPDGALAATNVAPHKAAKVSSAEAAAAVKAAEKAAKAQAATTGSALGEPGTTSPFSPGVPESTPTVATSTTPAVVTSTSTTSNSGLTGSSVIAIAIGAMIVLLGIALFIWRDARRNAPVLAHAGHEHGKSDGGRKGSKAPPKARKLSNAERKRRKRGRAR